MSAPYGWCVCDATRGQSCDWCSGDGADAREQRAMAKAAARQREQRIRTDPAFRAEWLLSFPVEMRAAMAEYADKAYGRLPVPVSVLGRVA